MSSLPVVDVVVGLVRDAQGRYLINRRRAGTHMAGRWEFPGGKREPDENPFAALVREFREELAVDIGSAVPMMRLSHRYSDRVVELDVWLIERVEGEPTANEGQALRWIALEALGHCGLLEADQPIVDELRARLAQ